MKSLEARKKQRAEARKAHESENKAPAVQEKDILDGSIAKIAASLDGMTVEQLDQLAERELAGQKRNGVADAIAKAKAKLASSGAGWQGNT